MPVDVWRLHLLLLLLPLLLLSLLLLLPQKNVHGYSCCSIGADKQDNIWMVRLWERDLRWVRGYTCTRSESPNLTQVDCSIFERSDWLMRVLGGTFLARQAIWFQPALFQYSSQISCSSSCPWCNLHLYDAASGEQMIDARPNLTLPLIFINHLASSSYWWLLQTRDSRAYLSEAERWGWGLSSSPKILAELLNTDGLSSPFALERPRGGLTRHWVIFLSFTSSQYVIRQEVWIMMGFVSCLYTAIAQTSMCRPNCQCATFQLEADLTSPWPGSHALHSPSKPQPECLVCLLLTSTG